MVCNALVCVSWPYEDMNEVSILHMDGTVCSSCSGGTPIAINNSTALLTRSSGSLGNSGTTDADAASACCDRSIATNLVTASVIIL